MKYKITWNRVSTIKTEPLRQIPSCEKEMMKQMSHVTNISFLYWVQLLLTSAYKLMKDSKILEPNIIIIGDMHISWPSARQLC